MDISVNWLHALAPSISGSPEELADRLSARAVPVDRTVSVGEELEAVVVARVLEVSKHPNADRLSLCRVDAGSGEPMDVVCGAPEVVEGALYPFIPAGTTLPGGFQIEKRKIRGVESNGMLCSEKELGLGRDAAGIMRLGDDHEPGEPLARALGLPDARLEVDLTPNRIDLACHVGVARELAPEGVDDVALPSFGGPTWNPHWSSGDETAESGGVTIHIEDPDRCYRYLGAIVRGVKIGPSPQWLQARIRAAGSRPINNVVDATNYVLLELNQPLHAFDLQRIGGAEIRVRAARNESLTTLDGADHRLGAEATVIADAERPLALAGVMGGAESEVTSDTVDLLIECAAFDPQHTRRTARATALATDASYRFERGIDEAGLERALSRCVELILATAGGEADDTAIRVGRPAPDPVHVRLRLARVRQVLGLHLSGEQIAALLLPLGFSVEGTGEEGELDVVVPGWRVDVRREVDLLEEVARRYGYDSFPHEPRSFRPSAVPDSSVWNQMDRVRAAMTSGGFLEARSSSFAQESRIWGEAVRLLKPLSEEEALLRTDLVPVLLGRLEHNWSRGHRDVRLFEIGSVFQRTGAESSGGTGAAADTAPFGEEIRVGLVMTGRRRPRHWDVAGSDYQIWDLTGFLEHLSGRLGLGELRVGEPPADDAPLAFGTGRWLGGDSLCILDDERLVGVGGSVSPHSVDAPVWAAPVFAAEFRLDGVSLRDTRTYRELPSYPAVARDLAFALKSDVPAGTVGAAMRDAAPATLESLELFDVYEGEGMDEGKRSLAWRLVFRAPDRTLTDDEVDEGLGSITANLKERFDARIRSS